MARRVKKLDAPKLVDGLNEKDRDIYEERAAILTCSGWKKADAERRALEEALGMHVQRELL